MWTTSLKTRFIIAVVGLMLVLGLAMILLAETVLRTKLDAKLEKRGMAIARSVARDSISPLLAERYVELALMARDVKKAEDDIEYIIIVNPQGAVVAHTFEGGFPAELNSVLKGNSGNTAVIHHYASDRGMIGDIVIPLIDGKAGWVHVGLSEVIVSKDIKDISRVIIMTVVGLMLLGVIFSVPVATTITKPIHQLSLAAEAIKRGDLHARVRIFSDDEVGHLAMVFNQMAESRMLVEEVLAASERKLRDITANLGEGVIVLNEHGCLVFMNPEAEKLLGWKEGELQGREIHDLVHNQKADGSPYPKEECSSNRVLATGEREMVDDEYFVRKDGKRFPVSFVTAPIYAGDKITSIVIAFRDITQRRQKDAEREQLLLAYQDAVDNINTLKGLLPICSSCKRIRDDKGYWNIIEVYVRDHSEAEFSHGICPDCAKKLYPEYYKDET